MSKVYFAENLRYLRNERGLTQVQLAKELGVTRSRIGSYEEKRSEPSLEVVVQIAEYFGTPVDLFITMNLVGSKQKAFYKNGAVHVG